MKPYYEQGGITIYHGDCREVLPHLTGVNLVIADPPYGIDCTKTGCGQTGRKGFVNTGAFVQRGGATIAGDKHPEGEWLNDAFGLLKPNTALYLFSRWDVDREWHTFIEQAGFVVKNRIVWAKANWGSGDLEGAFGFQYESLWRAVKGQSKLRIKRRGDVWRDVWTECVRRGKQHPFEKPIDLLKLCILADTDDHALVLDPFMGSGTTLRAAKDLGRKAIGIELEERYCELAARRLMQEVFPLEEIA